MVTIIMYLLWVSTIVVVLATTFTNFQYEDLNLLAVILFVFALVNSFFTISKK